MFPHERSLVRRMADKPFAIIGVNSDQDIGRKNLDEIREVVKEKNLSWRSFQNTGSEEKISATWNVKGWPTTYLIDKDGVIRYKNVRGEALDEALEELMAEMGQEVSLVGVDHEELVKTEAFWEMRSSSLSSEEKSIEKLPCPVCGKLFNKWFDIKRHMSTHTGEKPFTVKIL